LIDMKLCNLLVSIVSSLKNRKVCVDISLILNLSSEHTFAGDTRLKNVVTVFGIVFNTNAYNLRWIWETWI